MSMNTCHNSIQHRAERAFEAGIRLSQRMFQNHATPSHSLSWAVTFALSVCGRAVTVSEVNLRWINFFNTLNSDVLPRYAFTTMLRYLQQRLTELVEHVPVLDTSYHFSSGEEDRFVTIALDNLYDESVQVLRLAEDVSALTSARHIIPRALACVQQAAFVRGLHVSRWMQPTSDTIALKNFRLIPYSASLLKKPTALQCGFSHASARAKWFMAQVDSKDVWTNDRIIDRYKPCFRGWKRFIATCPGTTDPGMRPDVTSLFKHARETGKKVLRPLFIGEPAGSQNLDVIFYQTQNQDVMVLDRVSVSYLTHKYSQAVWRYSGRDAPVSVWQQEELVALLAPIKLSLDSNNTYPSVSDLKHAMLLQQH